MRLFLFDMDGTLAESGQTITDSIKYRLQLLSNRPNTEIGIVGGGKYEKIKEQLNGVSVHHLFSESGGVYHKNNIELYRKNIRYHTIYPKVNVLIQTALKFLSEVDYQLTGHFIDLRSGIIYISLIGMSATQHERSTFIHLDNQYGYRKLLLKNLKEKAAEVGIASEIDIVEGGSVGIAIYPREWDKEQVLEHFNPSVYSEVYYFGDKYTENGNDYRLLHNPRVYGVKVDSYKDTYMHLKNFL